MRLGIRSFATLHSTTMAQIAAIGFVSSMVQTEPRPLEPTSAQWEELRRLWLNLPWKEKESHEHDFHRWARATFQHALATGEVTPITAKPLSIPPVLKPLEAKTEPTVFTETLGDLPPGLPVAQERGVYLELLRKQGVEIGTRAQRRGRR